MNLEKLIEMQRKLDERIIRGKGLEGKDLVPNTYVALQVELAEMANEARWFKHWSENQEPNFEKTRLKICASCLNDPLYIVDCWKCGGTGLEADGICNPLLEEYVDALHFFLSLALQKGWEDALWIYEEQLNPDEFNGDLSAIYLEMLYFLNKSYFENPDNEYNEKWQKSTGFPAKQYWFRMAWIMFLNIGINGFGFTLEQIDKAYKDKNAVNHQRQAEGY